MSEFERKIDLNLTALFVSHNNKTSGIIKKKTQNYCDKKQDIEQYEFILCRTKNHEFRQGRGSISIEMSSLYIVYK